MKKKYLIIISMFLIIFLGMLGIVLFDKNLIFDSTIYNFIISFRCDALDVFFKTITKLGNTLTIIGIVCLFVLIFKNKYSLLLVISALDSVILNTMIKHIVRRERPSVLRLISQGGYSFPSGHAMISVCVYGFLLYLAFSKIKNKYLKYICSFLLFILIISIGLSRIYVGVHYASDIIAGYSLALIEVILLVQLDKNIKIEDGKICIKW